ncbi:MAG: enoyl-CoA hydratase/isomerase family protein [Pseudomonadota bacterium]
MTQDNLILETNADGITTLTLNCAPVNALSSEVLENLAGVFETLAQDAACRALIIQSPFKVFSAGLDLNAAAALDTAGEERIARALTLTFRALYAFPKPTVCAVGGAAIAGGFFFPAACDARLATAKATIGLAEVKVGVNLPVGPLEIARAELPPAACRRLLLSGDPISAEEALSFGFFDQITETLDDDAMAKALSFAALPAAAFAATKADLRRPAIETIDRALAAGAHAPGATWFLPDSQDHMRAMISGRKNT